MPDADRSVCIDRKIVPVSVPVRKALESAGIPGRIRSLKGRIRPSVGAVPGTAIDCCKLVFVSSEFFRKSNPRRIHRKTSGLALFRHPDRKAGQQIARIHLSKSMGGSDEFCSPEDNSAINV
tara:strand:+ start:213 stop:578 length:366 start_codon:yes stop_codon:yes gene_type:complete